MNKDVKAAKVTEPDCMLKSRFAAARLRDIVLGFNDNRRKLIVDRGWGVLLDICTFSAPKGLLQWIILQIDPELAEFRNNRNNTSILFNKEMVVKALGLPRGTRQVVKLGDHEESPYREFYKIDYHTAGRRAPIANAEKMLENAELDDETWFMTFYLVVIGTYFFPGSSIMLPLEYLGSLTDSTLVREYDWAEEIFRHTMSEIKSFQERMRKAATDRNIKPLWVGGCLPWIAIVYMDHLEFPVSSLSSHRINYAIPRASHVTDNDFKFVMKHDKSRLTLKAHTYGARPFRPFNVTPYADENLIFVNQAMQPQMAAQQATEANSSHVMQDEPPQPPTRSNNLPQELPDYMKAIIEKHITLWRKDVELATIKRMSEFASDVFAAVNTNATTPHGLSSQPVASTYVASSPTTCAPIISPPRDKEPAFLEEVVNISDPSCSKQTPSTQFWEEASRIADEVEKSGGKTTNRPYLSPSTTMQVHPITETSGAGCRGVDIECPTFDLLPAGETWTQHFAATNQPSPRVEVPCTICTQTQEKKNRKKRAFLGINNEANTKKTKKLKVTDKSKEVYETYILRRCIRPPVPGEAERPHFVDFGDYHISYEDFREALKPRGRIDTHVMELYIRHYNIVVNIPTTSEPMCTKFAFSQSLTAKLIVHEDKFDPKNCLKEFQQAYKEHRLKSKDMFYFAIVDNGHWVLVCINLIHKQFNILDSMMTAKNTQVYYKAHLLLKNFITLANAANAFPKTNFSQFVQNNPQDLRQQTTIFDCGVFVMLFMKLWDGKSVKTFGMDIIDHRMVITLMILTSELNKVDPTWVLKKK